MQSESLIVRCRGRWPEIIDKLAGHEDLRKAIERGLTAIARGATPPHGACPVHGGRHGDAFRVFDDFLETGGAVCNTCGRFGTGFKLLMWINGWDKVTTSRELKRVLNGEDPVSPRRNASVREQVDPAQSKSRGPSREYLLKLWSEAVPLTHADATPVRRYLAHRGLAVLDLASLLTLRCHPHLRYTDSKTQVVVGYFPALVAYVVAPTGELVAIHRTYLTEDGHKAPVEPVKKLLKVANATASGGCVRLKPVEAVGAVLCTGEGLENALTGLLRNPESPFWPATSAPLLGSLVVPSQVRHVVTWGDLEPAQRQPDGTVRQPGREAAEKLSRRVRAEARAAEVLIPRVENRTKMDWNKVLLEFGIEAIPKLSPTVRMLPTAYRLAQLSHGTVIRSG
jgi:putative DNA primase/helicase